MSAGSTNFLGSQRVNVLLGSSMTVTRHRIERAFRRSWLNIRRQSPGQTFLEPWDSSGARQTWQ